MKKLLTFIAVLCLPALIFAQNSGEIRGKVFDLKSKDTLVSAYVYVDINGKKMITTADINGQFILKPLNPGTYNVYFAYVGYDTTVIASVRVNPDKTTFMDTTFMTTRGVNFGDRLIIKDYIYKLIDPGDPSTQDLSHTQLTGTPDGRSISGAIRSYFTDVYVSDDGNEIYFRGARSDDAVYYVDGVKLRDNQLHVPGLAIGSMTVYTGGVPAKYGDFTGGVVVVETQSYFSWLNEKMAKENSKKNIF